MQGTAIKNSIRLVKETSSFDYQPLVKLLPQK